MVSLPTSPHTLLGGLGPREGGTLAWPWCRDRVRLHPGVWAAPRSSLPAPGALLSALHAVTQLILTRVLGSGYRLVISIPEIMNLRHGETEGGGPSHVGSQWQIWVPCEPRRPGSRVRVHPPNSTTILSSKGCFSEK